LFQMRRGKKKRLSGNSGFEEGAGLRHQFHIATER
jgi:hypothetical protein